MPLTLRRKPIFSEEIISDFFRASNSALTLPTGRLLIGSALYTANSLTFDFANGTGNNGLDTGIEQSSQFYALHAVRDSLTSNYILKATTNLPPLPPTGYSESRYLGTFRNDGAGDIWIFAKSGPRVLMTSGLPTLASSASTSSLTYTKTLGMSSGTNLPFASATYFIKSFHASGDSMRFTYGGAAGFVISGFAATDAGGTHGGHWVPLDTVNNQVTVQRFNGGVMSNPSISVLGWIDPLTSKGY